MNRKEKKIYSEFPLGGGRDALCINYTRLLQDKSLALHEYSFMNLMMRKVEKKLYTSSIGKGVN